MENILIFPPKKLNKEFFMDITYKQIKNCSTCAYYQVAAIIEKDHRIISFGYNGAPPGFIECYEIERLLSVLDDNEKNRFIEFYENYDKDSIEEKILYFLEKTNNEELRQIISKYLEKMDTNLLLKILYKSFKENMNFVHSRYEVHAEQNALLYALNSNSSVKGANLYVTMEPCLECAKLIILSGIKKVFYVDEYIDKRFGIRSSEFLAKNNIIVEKMKI